MSQSVRAIAPILAVVDGIPTTTSADVARHFSKSHDDVLRTIRNLLPQLDAKHARNFADMSIEVEIGNGAKRQSPAYRLTRDGFMLLAMGFTGKKALAFKLAYIDAFNRMEAQLKPSHSVKTRLPAPAIPVALSVPGPGRYTVYVDDGGAVTVKSLDGRSIIDADGARKLQNDMAHMRAALAELSYRMRIISGDESLSVVNQPLCVMLGSAERGRSVETA